MDLLTDRETDTESLDGALDKRSQVPLTIQQMARQSGLSEHTLRYYERIGLIGAVPRDGSSGHRRYSPETVADIERLACLHGAGMPIEDMRRYLQLRARGDAAASDQKALFQSHGAALDRQIALLQLRRTYIAGKVAFWEAVEASDREAARAIAARNQELARELTNVKENG